jgi:hypothetical protein
MTVYRFKATLAPHVIMRSLDPEVDHNLVGPGASLSLPRWRRIEKTAGCPDEPRPASVEVWGPVGFLL